MENIGIDLGSKESQASRTTSAHTSPTSSVRSRRSAPRHRRPSSALPGGDPLSR